MTTLNTIIEEEKVEQFTQSIQDMYFIAGAKINIETWNNTKDILRNAMTTAMQRAYEAGGREADAKWEREVEKEIRDVQAILVDIGSGAFSRDQMIHAENVIDRAIEIRNEANTILDTLLSKIRSTPTTNHTGE